MLSRVSFSVWESLHSVHAHLPSTLEALKSSSLSNSAGSLHRISLTTSECFKYTSSTHYFTLNSSRDNEFEVMCWMRSSEYNSVKCYKWSKKYHGLDLKPQSWATIFCIVLRYCTEYFHTKSEFMFTINQAGCSSFCVCEALCNSFQTHHPLITSPKLAESKPSLHCWAVAWKENKRKQYFILIISFQWNYTVMFAGGRG